MSLAATIFGVRGAEGGELGGVVAPHLTESLRRSIPASLPLALSYSITSSFRTRWRSWVVPLAACAAGHRARAEKRDPDGPAHSYRRQAAIGTQRLKLGLANGGAERRRGRDAVVESGNVPWMPPYWRSADYATISIRLPSIGDHRLKNSRRRVVRAAKSVFRRPRRVGRWYRPFQPRPPRGPDAPSR